MTADLYICRLILMIFARKHSRQTLALLTAFATRPQAWQHGYEISKETGLKSGTLYPLLMRLSDQGLLDSRWNDAERPGRPPRHVYRLTAPGLALVRKEVGVPAESGSGLTPVEAVAR